MWAVRIGYGSMKSLCDDSVCICGKRCSKLISLPLRISHEELAILEVRIVQACVLASMLRGETLFAGSTRLALASACGCPATCETAISWQNRLP